MKVMVQNLILFWNLYGEERKMIHYQKLVPACLLLQLISVFKRGSTGSNARVSLQMCPNGSN